MKAGTELQYFLTDHLGSIVTTLDSTGTLISQQRYLPFGAPRSVPNSPIIGTDLGYTGQRLLDSGMGGIMDYKARFFSPYLNHFLQPDTIIPDLSNPQSWNRYSYVTNRPVNFNDPTGHVMTTDSDGGSCDWQCFQDSREKQRILKSTIRIGFGINDDKGELVAEKGGLGTVVSDRRTIVTAAHIYLRGSTVMGYRTGPNGRDLTLIDINDVDLNFSKKGDMLTISLHKDLPKSFLPARPNPNHIFYSLENVAIVYQDKNRSLGILDTELTFSPFSRYIDGTRQYVAKDLDSVLTSGDSGGGVFHNGLFVGLNSWLTSTFEGPAVSFQPYK
jgi:RHS repeat-associated protein